ncbi:MAG: HEPN domain-containing protein [Promethearchaeota archaeon]
MFSSTLLLYNNVNFKGNSSNILNIFQYNNESSDHLFKHGNDLPFIPFLEILFDYNFSEDFRAVLDWYAIAIRVNDPILTFFCLTSSLDALLTNWATFSNLRYLWEPPLIDSSIWDEFQSGLRKSIEEFVEDFSKKYLDRGDEKAVAKRQYQINSFLSGSVPLPSERRIRRSIRQLFNDYVINIPKKYKDLKVIKKAKKIFKKNLDLRNDIAHGNKIDWTSEQISELLNDFILLMTKLLRVELMELIDKKNHDNWKIKKRDFTLSQLLEKPKPMFLPTNELFSSILSNEILINDTSRNSEHIANITINDESIDEPIALHWRCKFNLLNGSFIHENKVMLDIF